MLRHCFRPLALPLALLVLAGCSPLYVLKSAAGHGGLLWRREKISDLLADPKVSETVKDRLRLVEDIRRFAFEEMHLKPSRDYTSVSKVSGPVTTIVSGCEKTRFKPYLWWFPIIGRVPYKGYFKKEDAAREKKRLERKDYDAALGGAVAYNTPLWFSDPIPSTVLEDSPGELASLLIHEYTHGTIFIKNQVGFNESLAEFMGNQGAEEFLARRFGPGSKEAAEFGDLLEKNRAFSRLMAELYAKLDALYQSGASQDEKLKLRGPIFDWGREKMKEVGRDMGERLNNALVLAHRLYNDDQEDFKAFYEKNGRDWARAIAAIKTLDRKTPRKDLRRLGR